MEEVYISIIIMLISLGTYSFPWKFNFEQIPETSVEEVKWMSTTRKEPHFGKFVGTK